MKTVDLEIEGLATDADAQRASAALHEVAGVLSVVTNLEEHRIRVEGQNLDLAPLQAVLQGAGFVARQGQSTSDAEERLYVDAHNMELSPNFWCHMGRYLHARAIVAQQRVRRGTPLRVLDAASGTGYGTYLLSRAGDICDGVDLSEQAIEFSRKKYERENCHFTQGSVLELPFDDATFDVAVSFETIEHLPREAQFKFVRELRRVLKPGGQLVLSAPVSNGGAEKPEHNHHHAYEPDAHELVALVEKAFDQVTVRGQLLSSLDAPTTAAPDSADSQVEDAASAPKLSPAKRARELARDAANSAWKSSYLEKPATLQTVMNALYGGYLIKPLDLQAQRATFVVLQANA